MEKTQIEVYSHGIKVLPHNPKSKDALYKYCYNFAEWGWERQGWGQRPRKVIKKVYAAATKDRSQFRFHRNCLEDLLAHLDGAGIPKQSIEITELDPPTPVSVDLKMKGDLTPRDNQKDLISFLSVPHVNIKVTNLQTGQGKTFTSLFATANIGYRLAVCVRGGFISRWITGIMETLDVSKKEIMVVRGTAALQSYINQALNNELQAKIVIFSWKTLYKLYQQYELNTNDNIFGIDPKDLFAIAGIGTKIVDEVHLDYHFNFRSDVYTNIDNAIYLSATLHTEDKFRRDMYDIALPKTNWHKGVEYEVYIDTYAIMYNTSEKHSKYIRTKERGSDYYSHGAYEKSIMKRKDILENYLKLIRWDLDIFYLNPELYKPGQKAVVFCSIVEFCEITADYLKTIYPDFKIGAYNADTPVEKLDELEIIITTVESCGVAQDIPDLAHVCLTRAVRKLEANEQIKGRLRKLKKWPEQNPIFTYFVNQSVPKHIEYHEAKMEQFKGKVLTHNPIFTEMEI